MATSDSPRRDGDVSTESPSRKSFVRLDPDATDEEREAQIMEWLEDILGPPSDTGDHPD